MFSKKSFTLIEVMLVVAIVAILVALAATNLTGFQNATYLENTTTTVVDDLKQQQLKAMTGDTEGRGTLSPYGIKFETTRYVLFYGLTYSSTDTSNVPVNFDNNIQLSSTTLPQGIIIFQKGSGEVYNFISGSNTITLRNTNTNQQKTITINKYGTIITVN